LEEALDLSFDRLLMMIQILVKSDKNDSPVIRRPTNIYDQIYQLFCHIGVTDPVLCEVQAEATKLMT